MQATRNGFVKTGTHATCPFHGVPASYAVGDAIPVRVVTDPAERERLGLDVPEVPLEPRPPIVDCEACGYSHPGGWSCPDL